MDRNRLNPVQLADSEIRIQIRVQQIRVIKAIAAVEEGFLADALIDPHYHLVSIETPGAVTEVIESGRAVIGHRKPGALSDAVIEKRQQRRGYPGRWNFVAIERLPCKR